MVTDEKNLAYQIYQNKIQTTGMGEWSKIHVICDLQNTKGHSIKSDIFTDDYPNMGWILLNQLLNVD